MIHGMKRFLIRILVAVGVLAIALLVLRPEDKAGSGDSYFATLNQELLHAGIAGPAVVIDLDRVDQNLAAIKAHIKPPLQYRIVDKSLPSVPLIRHVMEKTGSKRVMSFHQPYLSMLYRELASDVDFLLGKPMPVAAARAFYAGLPTGAHADGGARVQWLIDTDERMRQYAALAEELGQTLRVNLEIDVGLHRGGAKTVEELERMFAVIAAHPKTLRFSGYMGYDGHLTHVPVLLGSKEEAVQEAFEDLVASYRRFVDYGAARYPDWFTGPITLNGAGSKTYRLYTAEHPLNDLAMGSCVVKPAAFDEFTLAEHLPAMYIAAPVLKKLDGFDVPFLDSVAPAAAWWNPNWRKSFYVYGGAWSEAVVWPQGLTPNSLTTSAPNENLFPNQNLLNGSDSLALDVGDFVFYHPKQGDAMSQFEDILVVRGGKIVDRWKPFPHRL
jgi:D-serine deaminase-like pyridoxal phosphate-dependent protein